MTEKKPKTSMSAIVVGLFLIPWGLVAALIWWCLGR